MRQELLSHFNRTLQIDASFGEYVKCLRIRCNLCFGSRVRRSICIVRILKNEFIVVEVPFRSHLCLLIHFHHRPGPKCCYDIALCLTLSKYITFLLFFINQNYSIKIYINIYANLIYLINVMHKILEKN